MVIKDFPAREMQVYAINLLLVGVCPLGPPMPSGTEGDMAPSAASEQTHELEHNPIKVMHLVGIVAFPELHYSTLSIFFPSLIDIYPHAYT